MAGSSVPRRATERGATPAPSAPAVSPAGPAVGQVMGRIAGGTLELVAVLALTLAFFGAFLVLMGTAFPAGEDLRTLALQGRRSMELATYDGTAGGMAPDDATAGPFALLDVLRPDVMRRASQRISWDPVRTGQELMDRDAIQTGADGRALVRFGPTEELQLERNSLIVLGRVRAQPGAGGFTETGALEPDDPSEGPRRGLLLVEGEMWARLEAPEHTQIELSLPKVVARLADATSKTPARFRVNVRPDRSATVAVFSGRLSLESRTGTVTIGAKQFSHVTPDGAVSSARRLPDAPADCLPREGSSYAHLDLPPQVMFSWSRVPEAGHYRLRVARDAQFRDVVLDENIAAESLTWGRAGPGLYWWQVAAVVDDVEGPPAAIRTLEVRRDVLPLRLAVQAPPRIVREAQLTLRGDAEPDARVFVMSRPAEVERSGEFQIDLELQPGANVLVVEAVDATGRTSYWSQVVHFKP